MSGYVDNAWTCSHRTEHPRGVPLVLIVALLLHLDARAISGPGS